MESLRAPAAANDNEARDMRAPSRPREPVTPPPCPFARRVTIYRPASSPKQAGQRAQPWVMEFEPEIAPFRRRVFAADPLEQVRLHFATLEQARAYARRHGYEAEVVARPSPRLNPRFSGQSFDIAA